MDVTKTRNELIREAADKLNIVGTGQALEAEYFDKLDGNVDPLFAQLASDEICEIIHDQQIPSDWFDALAGLLANVCSPLGGRNYDPGVKQFYEMQLKRMNSAGTTYTVQENEYF